MASPPGGFKAGNQLYFIDADKIQRRIAAYARVGENIVEEMSGRLGNFHKAMIAETEKNFKQKIGSSRANTRDVSRSVGGAPGYGIAGKRGRQTGRFVGPTAHAFKGIQRKDGKGHRQVVGFPNVQYADSQTKGIWRQLEFGAPEGFTKRPVGLFLPAGSDPNDANFKRGRARLIGERKVGKSPGANFTGPEFHPQGRTAYIPNPEQPGWFFIRDAFDTVSKRELSKFRKLAVSSFAKTRR